MGGATSPGLKGAISRIEKFATGLGKGVAKRLAPKINKRYETAFATQTNIYGKPQPPLAESTLRRKRNTPGGSHILQRFFELVNGTYVLATDKRLIITIGASGQYAHEGDSGRGNRPPRLLLPSLGIPKTWKSDAETATAEVAKRGAA
jgi:hypothetical protein